ncbi:NACHT domain-containing protein [Hydrogenophaga sp.]|uniref:NACHT domain-containing protein n=1 Tax=Hydrogenophaga sp. TaxID=1904254 RepID=UPI002FCBC331
MTKSYELSGLDPYAFENLINVLALRVLGNGSSGFGPGSDGGRDGIFEGEAPYPSTTERWKGTWYIQSKFHSPHLSRDSQKWLIAQARAEIKLFESPENERVWPDNWIIATNIEPSGTPKTGSYDVINAMVKEAVKKKVNVHIWGGRKILDFFVLYPDIAQSYAHFITPGKVLSTLQDQLGDQYGSVKTIINYLVATQFSEQIYTKLDQAGSSSDTRPGVHHLFIDLPLTVSESNMKMMALDHLCRASARPHRHSVSSSLPKSLREWSKYPHNARVALIKGGPGQGKSTVGQYFCQIQRAALLLLPNAPKITDKNRAVVNDVKAAAERIEAWPSVPRIPISVELRDYAHWYGTKKNDEARGVLTYLAARIGAKVEQTILPSTLRRTLGLQSWFVLFDGLDEVPNDVKDRVADEVVGFVNDIVVQDDADVLTLCTSRPQGYSGQFSALDGPVLNLQMLDVKTAIRCAEPVVRYDRSADEGARSLDLLKSAAASISVQQLMTTPLQSHIMAVVVRDGGRPPERRWQLFENFYQVMKKRESLKNVHNPRISKLLREEDRLLRAVHTRLGFVLHARAERSDGALTTLTKHEFRELVNDVVLKLTDDDSSNVVEVVMEAMTERLVLVSTPENGANVRFDIRQLQEFFAAEFLYDSVLPSILARRVSAIGGDSHWMEVMHFLLSALIENKRTTETDVTIKALEQINNGNENGEHRLFHRRMAKGTILAMRLLSEGVLEQDKRDRIKFRTLFDSFGGMIDNNVLTHVHEVHSVNSRAWLISVLLEKITEASPSESIGAFIALGYLLPADHPATRELTCQFSNFSTSYQIEILNAWCDRSFGSFHAEQDQVLSLWAVACVVSAANSEAWRCYDAAGKAYINGILQRNYEKILPACAILNIDNKLASLMHSVFRWENSGNTEAKSFSFGLVETTLHVHNWSTASLPSEVEQALNLECDFAAQGLFQVICGLLNFKQTTTFIALKHVLALIPVGEENMLRGVPSWIVALLPCRTAYYKSEYDCSHLRCMSSDEFSSFWANGRFEMFPAVAEQLMLCDNKDLKLKDWEYFFEHLPAVAVNILLMDNLQWFANVEVALDSHLQRVKQIFLSSPKIARNNYLSWGQVFRDDADGLNDLRTHIRTLPLEDVEYVHAVSNIVSIGIDEKNYYSVYFFALGMLAIIEGQTDKEWTEMVDVIASNLREFDLDSECLARLKDDCAMDARIRVAAHFLLVFVGGHSSVKGNLNSSLSQLPCVLSMCREFDSSWYARGICMVIGKEMVERDSNAVLAVETLLAGARELVCFRAPLSQLLMVWRETSALPIDSSDSLSYWLDE